MAMSTGTSETCRVPLTGLLPFGLTIFSGAFLLFLVQPLIGRFILPWFGGSPAVWTTCLLFFQVLLVGGYAYADLSIRRLRPRRQVILHLALLAVALLLLPITPGDAWKPPDGAIADGADPAAPGRLPWAAVPRAIGHRTADAGVVQRGQPGHVALPALCPVERGLAAGTGRYPFLVEPNLARRAQASAWSVGLVGFALAAAWCGGIVWTRAGSTAANPHETPPVPTPAEAGGPLPLAEGTSKGPWLWFALPACASVLLLAVTNTICQDIAVIPFLWVLPLGLYLLSFILSFDSPRWYARPLWIPMLALALASVVWMTAGPGIRVPEAAVLTPIRWLLHHAGALSLFKTIAIYLGTLFISCMVCHGELYRLRPPPQRLTAYYLAIAAGGAAGGVFVAVLAPLVFKDYFEMEVGLLAVGVLAAVVLFVDPGSPLHHGRHVWAWAPVLLALLGLGAGLYRGAAGLPDTRRGLAELLRRAEGQ